MACWWNVKRHISYAMLCYAVLYAVFKILTPRASSFEWVFKKYPIALEPFYLHESSKHPQSYQFFLNDKWWLKFTWSIVDQYWARALLSCSPDFFNAGGLICWCFCEPRSNRKRQSVIKTGDCSLIQIQVFHYPSLALGSSTRAGCLWGRDWSRGIW